MKVNEKDSLLDLLMQEKEVIKLYGSMIPEGSTKQLRDILQRNLDSVVSEQFNLFELMKNKGYYPIKEAEQTCIDEVKTAFAQK